VEQEKARAFQGKKIDGFFQFTRDKTFYVNRYYFYLDDAEFGSLFLKVCSYAPWGTKLCLNDRVVTKKTPGEFRTRVIQGGVHPTLHIDCKNFDLKLYVNHAYDSAIIHSSSGHIDFQVTNRAEFLSLIDTNTYRKFRTAPVRFQSFECYSPPRLICSATKARPPKKFRRTRPTGGQMGNSLFQRHNQP
jgi:hypothetical protein